jgi:hypothetical protein
MNICLNPMLSTDCNSSHMVRYQEMEFTVENMKLYVLETTKAPRTPQAALRIATNLVEENILTAREALMTVDPEHMTFFTRDSTLYESGILSIAYRLCRT